MGSQEHHAMGMDVIGLLASPQLVEQSQEER